MIAAFWLALATLMPSGSLLLITVIVLAVIER